MTAVERRGWLKGLLPTFRRSSPGAQAVGELKPTAVAADPITAALAGSADATDRPLPTELRRRLRERIADARQEGDHAAALAEALNAVRDYPASDEAQIIAARILELRADAETMRETFRAIAQRFPASIDPIRLFLRYEVRLKGSDAAREALSQHFPSVPDQPDAATALAMALLELDQVEEADETFAILLDEHPRYARGWLLHARNLHQRGKLREAIAALQQAVTHNQSSATLRREFSTYNREATAIRIITGKEDVSGDVASIAVLRQFLTEIVASRKHTAQSPSFLGSVMMITSTLGAGGAARQLVNSAITIQNAARTGEPLAGFDVLGPVSVLVRSLSERANGDFFLPDLMRERIEVLEYTRLQPFGGNPRLSRAAPHERLFGFLPKRMSEGISRLTDFLVARRPDVVSIWQDGMVYATGVAALLADVPRIVLHVRTLPPSERVDRSKPEYETLYRLMLSAPNVVMVSNSEHAARRYEAWLGLPTGRVRTVHNGVRALPPTPLGDAADMLRRFDLSTGPARFTLGSVMRFDDNKRPLHWMEVARRVLDQVPDARFILAGDGPMRAETEKYAAQIGIDRRCLFVGRSECVGFWLRQMQAFMLLSRYEGLPNVLIEAQSVGIPVVTTPAGGAAETILDGITGHVLADAAELDTAAAAATVLDLVSSKEKLASIREAAMAHVEDTFSPERMAEETISVFMGGYGF